MKTIGNIIHTTTFPLEIFDEEGNRIYYESVVGFWARREFDSKGYRTYYENSEGRVIR